MSVFVVVANTLVDLKATRNWQSLTHHNPQHIFFLSKCFVCLQYIFLDVLKYVVGAIVIPVIEMRRPVIEAMVCWEVGKSF